METNTELTSFFKDLKGQGGKGLRQLTKSLKTIGIVPKPSFGFRFFINALTHVSIIFLALLMLWIVIINKVEQRALEGEFKKQIEKNLGKALDNANKKSGGKFKEYLQPLRVPIETIQSLFTGDDPTRTNFNNSLLLLGFGIVVFLITIVVTALCTSSRNGVPVGRMLASVLLENFSIFIIVGVVEIMFFLTIAQFFVPIKPSVVINLLIKDMKAAFNQ
jgi:hypothetical protein